MGCESASAFEKEAFDDVQERFLAQLNPMSFANLTRLHLTAQDIADRAQITGRSGVEIDDGARHWPNENLPGLSRIGALKWLVCALAIADRFEHGICHAKSYWVEILPWFCDVKARIDKVYAERRHAVPTPGELLSVALRLHPGKNKPSFTVTREGGQPVERSLQQAEYDVLLCLAQAMRKSRKRRNQPVKEWGWVKRENLVAVIASRSEFKRNAPYYLTTIVSRLRGKLAGAIQEAGLAADPLRVIENAAPSSEGRRSLYRLTIHPDGLIFP